MFSRRPVTISRWVNAAILRCWGGDQSQRQRRALVALIDRTETLSKQVLSLINLNAVLLREVSLAQQEPLEHSAKLEAEIGGLGEAIAVGTRQFTDVPVSSEAITEVFEQVLRQGRALVDVGHHNSPGSN
jgi:hypothetical protein